MKIIKENYSLNEEEENKVNERFEQNWLKNTQNIKGVDKKQAFIGYLGEYLFSNLLSFTYKKAEDGLPYDYYGINELDGKYVDIKTMSTIKTPEEAGERRYRWYIQESQIKHAKNFCDKNNIEYKNFKFIIQYINTTKQEIYILFSNNANLDRLLKHKVIQENPKNTGSEKIMKNRIIYPDWKNIKYINLKK